MTVFDILKIACGLALFLYGMQLMSDSLKQSAGSRLRDILAKMTASPVRGFLLGLVITMIIQSSSATTVMVIGFVNSGTMTLLSSVGVIMGANVGAALTFWLTSLSSLGGAGAALSWLKPSAWMPILALIGIVLIMVYKRGQKRDIGLIFLGFSILMVGMDTMSQAVEGLKEDPTFANFMTAFNNPLLALLVGIAVTALIQSSAASVGILQSLATTGQVSFATAIPITMGQNIGTCITAILACTGAGKNGKRAAIIHLGFNTVGTVVWLSVYVAGTAIFKDLGTLAATTPIQPWQIALVHTIFKVLTVAILSPFYRGIEKLSRKIVKEDENEKLSVNLLDDRLFTTPSLAVARAVDVTSEMAEICRDALLQSITLLSAYDEKVAANVRALEERGDIYEDDIGSYLIRAAGCHMEEKESREVTKLLRVIGDLERISDHAVNLVESAEEMRAKKVVFSDEANREIAAMVGAISEILVLSIDALLHNDVALAASVEPLEQVVDELCAAIKARHAIRLTKNECSMEYGFILSDLLTNFERVSDHCSNIAGCVIEITSHDSLSVHHYLAEIKNGTPAFTKMYKDYSEKYKLA